MLRQAKTKNVTTVTIVAEHFNIVYADRLIPVSVYTAEFVTRIKQVQPIPICEHCGHECIAAIIDVGNHIYCAWHVPQFAETDVSASLDYLTHQYSGTWSIRMDNPPD